MCRGLQAATDDPHEGRCAASLLSRARQATKPRDHLLVPGIPSPNGALHLGHIAGPFLRMDALARYVRMRGGRVFLISGTDALESYVLHTATRTGTEPASVARRFHRLIETDLGSLDIETDAFIDPLAPRGPAATDTGSSRP